MAFDPNKFEKVKASFDPEKFQKSKSQESISTKVGQKALNIASGALETLNAPYELVGESLRLPIEQDSDFRAPTILQRLGLADKTALPPENPFSLVNKLLRAGAGALSGIPEGKSLEKARQAYFQDRGLMGVVEDTVLGVLLGKVAPQVLAAPGAAALKAPGAVAKGAKNVVKGAGKKALRTMGLSEEALSLRYNRPNEVINAKSIDELSGAFTQSLDDLRTKVETLDNEAWDTLLKLKAEPRSKLISIIQNVKREVQGTGKVKIGDADRAAVKKLDEYIARIKTIKQPGTTSGTEQFIDQTQLRELLQSIRRDIDFDNPASEPLNNAIKSIQGKVDAVLKQNGNYAEVMDQLAPATKTLEEAKRLFKVKFENGRFVPSDTTAQKLARINQEKKPETARIVDMIKKQTGVDFADQVKLSNAKQQFKPGAENSRGSARTVMGGLAGMALEPFIPGPQGMPTLVLGALGRASDYYGGAAAGKIVDAASKSGTKVGSLLSRASNPRTSRILDLVRMGISRQPIIQPAFSRLEVQQ